MFKKKKKQIEQTTQEDVKCKIHIYMENQQEKVLSLTNLEPIVNQNNDGYFTIMVNDTVIFSYRAEFVIGFAIVGR